MALNDGRGSLEVVCLGESMLMLAPSPNELIEACSQFVPLLGGAEANVAIGLERLGLRAGWIGKLPRNALGRWIVGETRRYGVDTSGVVWADEGRVGLFFVEWGAKPRGITTIYDRANSAAATLTADELNWDYIRRARWLHLTGINPALSETCRVATREIATRARAAGLSISFDVNYRSLLWSIEDAHEALADILPHVDLLITTEAEAALLLEERLSREETLRCLLDRYSLEAAVMTLGDEGSVGFDGRQCFRSSGYAVEKVNRLGAGDAFVAGLLFGYLRSGLQSGLEYGSAMAALKMTIPQNVPIVTRDAVEQIIERRQNDLIR